VTNTALAGRMVTRSVGPFQVIGLDSAVTSLSTIMTSIAFDQRLVYRVLGTAGMQCARNVRGSITNISNHSWGTAIDLTIDNFLDARGDEQIPIRPPSHRWHLQRQRLVLGGGVHDQGRAPFRSGIGVDSNLVVGCLWGCDSRLLPLRAV
jgi:hypothetical protein